MKDLLKKKMQHVINLHVHIGGKNLKEDEDVMKTSDLAPMVEDKGKPIEGSPQEEMSEPMHEAMAEGDNPVMSPEQHDNQRVQLLQNIGADASQKNPRSLRGKAMHAAGQEMNKLKMKKKLNKV